MCVCVCVLLTLLTQVHPTIIKHLPVTVATSHIAGVSYCTGYFIAGGPLLQEVLYYKGA